MYKTHRMQLESLRGELETRVAKARTSLTSLRSADWSEQATERENDEVLLELVREAEEELNQIKKALNRMDSGKYGECMHCGELINPERLTVMPMSTLCIECAKEIST